jgi:hypothetical protein
MLRRHDCITDPTARAWWRDYRTMCREGNPLGLSFMEYIAQRVLSTECMSSYTAADDSPWYVAACGHQHQWGASCSEMSATT